LLHDGFLRRCALPAPALSVLADAALPAQSQAIAIALNEVAVLGLHTIGRIGCEKRNTSLVRVFAFL